MNKIDNHGDKCVHDWRQTERHGEIQSLTLFSFKCSTVRFYPDIHVHCFFSPPVGERV